jgi:NAD(P)-dependent dehydrogenase (short-subunit alcohol dehydrogenase family)
MSPTPRVALVTGASRGIGAAIAIELARRGVTVALHYRTQAAAAEAVRARCNGQGHTLHAADLGDTAACASLHDDVLKAHGRVDILINNAGIFVDHPPLTTAPDAWTAALRDILATNLAGPWELSGHALRHMAARPVADDPFGRGRIVNVSSRGAFRGEPDSPAYGASKAALNALSQSLAKALAPSGIYVYALAPGWVGTDMAHAHLNGPDGAAILAQHPLGRVTSPEELAALAVFCALDAPAAMTGGVLDINGASYLRT